MYSIGPHTITVEGYELEQLKHSQTITVQVDNVHVTITNPAEEETISNTIAIQTNTSSAVTVVLFYIDSTWLCTDTTYPFECQLDTCLFSNGAHVITAQAYGQQPLTDSAGILDVPIGDDHVTAYIDNFCIEIVTPLPGAHVFVTTPITMTAGTCIDGVEFYVDGVYKDTDFFAPFEYLWDTTAYPEDEPCTILVKAYYQGKLKCTRDVTVIVDNYCVEILTPQEDEVVSGIYDITVYARGVDNLQYYYNDFCMHSENIQGEPPYSFSWDTTEYQNGSCTITVKGYKSFELKDTDSVDCTISNQSTILLLGLLAGITGFAKKRH
ncbi:MAG: Ig-like domain-containing protein [Theionarchaea archaeon]|nr:Ig-like domain-containing protein [Theionarchaea archaeon]